MRAILSSEVLTEAFFSQPAVDQRHGIESAQWVLDHGGRADMVVAALVHDIGKRHARLGTIARSLVSAASKLGLPTGTRGRRYLTHGVEGAGELEAAGAPTLAVEFARHHHAARPASIPQQDWDLLVASDEVFGRRPRTG